MEGGPQGITIAGERIVLWQAPIWYMAELGGIWSSKPELGALVLTESSLLFLAQRPMGAKGGMETKGVVLRLPIEKIIEAKVEERVRLKGSKPRPSVYAKISKGSLRVNIPPRRLDSKETFRVLVLRVLNQSGNESKLLFEWDEYKDSEDGMKQVVDYISTQKGPRSHKPDSYLLSELEEFDRLLGKGLPPSRSFLMKAPLCMERDELTLSLIKRALDMGGSVLEISQRAEPRLDLLKRYSGRIVLILCNKRAASLFPQMDNILCDTSLENLSDIGISISKAISILSEGSSNGNPKLAILEILSDVLLHHQALTTKRWLSDILPRIKLEGFIVFGLLNPLMHSQQEVEAIVEAFDGVAELIKSKADEPALFKLLRPP